jgi:hypothetical protein
MTNIIAISVTVLFSLFTFVVAGLVIVRMARKRGVRVRDLIGPGP